MSRTKRAKITRHCNVPGCAVCQANDLHEAQNRKFKIKKQTQKVEADND